MKLKFWNKRKDKKAAKPLIESSSKVLNAIQILTQKVEDSQKVRDDELLDLIDSRLDILSDAIEELKVKDKAVEVEEVSIINPGDSPVVNYDHQQNPVTTPAHKSGKFIREKRE